MLSSWDRHGLEGEIADQLWLGAAILERAGHRNAAEELYVAAALLSARIGYAAAEAANPSVVRDACGAIADRVPAEPAAGASWTRSEAVASAVTLLSAV